MDLLHLSGEGRAPDLERHAPAIFERGLIDVGAVAPIGPMVVLPLEHCVGFPLKRKG